MHRDFMIQITTQVDAHSKECPVQRRDSDQLNDESHTLPDTESC
jgi:hypothetical protein